MFVILWASHMICAGTANAFNRDLNMRQTVAKLMTHLLSDSEQQNDFLYARICKKKKKRERNFLYNFSCTQRWMMFIL
jgi:diacylglycerol kinase family enzyme